MTLRAAGGVLPGQVRIHVGENGAHSGFRRQDTRPHVYADQRGWQNTSSLPTLRRFRRPSTCDQSEHQMTDKANGNCEKDRKAESQGSHHRTRMPRGCRDEGREKGKLSQESVEILSQKDPHLKRGVSPFRNESGVSPSPSLARCLEGSDVASFTLDSVPVCDRGPTCNFDDVGC